jgi:hypothetical protein
MDEGIVVRIILKWIVGSRSSLDAEARRKNPLPLLGIESWSSSP